jgi:CRP-like cAMP-binding protein
MADVPQGEPTRRELLARVPLFRGISSAEADQLAAVLRRHEGAQGEAVIRQDDAGDELFIVESGQLTVTISSAGREVRVGRLGPLDVFGEMAVLRATPRTATVTADAPVVLWALSRGHLTEVLARNEALAKRFDEEIRRRDVENALRLLQ